MHIEILNRAEKEKIMEKLNENYGVKDLNFLLVKQGKEKIRGFTGNLGKDEILRLSREINIETLGLYLLTEEKDSIRLSFDAPTLLKPEKNIIEISDLQAEEWLKGRNLEIEDMNLRGFVIIKNKDNLLGCGKASQGRIANFVPKERRRKN